MTQDLIHRARQVATASAVGVCVFLLAFWVLIRLAPMTGHELITITGGSMEPAIPIGSMVAISPVEPATIAVGDIVTVRAGNGVLVTHRVARILDDTSGRRFELRGDANTGPDASLVRAPALVGRVVLAIPVLGSLRSVLADPAGLAAAAVLVASLFAAELALGALEPRARASRTDAVSEGSTP